MRKERPKNNLVLPFWYGLPTKATRGLKRGAEALGVAVAAQTQIHA